MDKLETILTLFTDLQADEGLDLSEYASRFVEVAEASDVLTTEINDGQANSEANQRLIDDLKSENWDLSKKITTKEDVADEPKETETEEVAEVEDTEKYETSDEAIEDLFKDEDKEKEKEVE